MKTLIRKDTKVSCFLWEDDIEVTIESDQVLAAATTGTVTGTLFRKINISYLNSDNAEIIENVEPPVDWISEKYTYDGKWARSNQWGNARDNQIIELQNRIAELEKGK
jgi:hypothetical protein